MNLPHRFPWSLFLLLLLPLRLTACAEAAWPEFASLLEKQPFVLEVFPEDGNRIEASAEFILRFSERLDLATLEKSAVALLWNAEEEALLDVGDLIKDLQSGAQSSVTLHYLLNSAENELSLLPEEPLREGIYHLVVTPTLRSVEGLPFNQQPGETPRLFIARYAVGEAALAQLGKDPAGGDAEAPPVFGPEPDILMIHEFLYDGIISETDGEAFVELYGTPGADISLYQILFLNGANGAETDRITLPPPSLIGEDGIFLIADLKTGSKTESRVPGADFLDHFDPQNGPDGIQLLNRNGELLDTVVYGEGAVSVAENGFPLGEGAPAPDVAAGHSLSRSSGVDSDDNAADFRDLDDPSPGRIEE